MSPVGAVHQSRHFAGLWLIPLALAISGCGEDDSGTEENAPNGETATSLVVTKPDGTRVEFSDIVAECGPSDYDADTQVVRARVQKDGAALLVEIVPADVEGGRSYDLPLSAGDDETGPENALVYVSAEPDFESSSDEEESTGTLEVIRASCDPVEVEFTIDASLGSEFYDVEGLNVEGHLQSP